MAKIHDLVYGVGGNLARPSHFDVILTFPKIFNSNSDKKYNILAKNVKFPSKKMDTIEYKYKGQSIKLPGRVSYEGNISLTFVLDENYTIKSELDDWINSIDIYQYSGTKHDNKYKLIDIENKKGSMIIIAKDWDEGEVLKYSLNEIYPVSVSAPDFSSDSVSTATEITVEFEYFKCLKEDFFLHDIISNIEGELESFVTENVSDILKPIKSFNKNFFSNWNK